MSKNALPVEIDRIHLFYQEYINKYGVSAGWSTRQSAENAYIAGSSCANQNWPNFRSVLDVGSGEGHFLSFLRSKCGFIGQYTGIELLPFFYEKSIELYGKQDKAEFICAEFLAHDFGTKKFDWVVSLGALAVKQKQQKEYDLAFCRKMISLARYGISIYLNDINQMKPGRLEKVPDLAAHDIDLLTSMLKKECYFSNIDVLHYPLSSSQNTMIHLTIVK